MLRRLAPVIILTVGVSILFLVVLSGPEAFSALLRIEPLAVAAALLLAIVPWFTDAARSAVWSRFLGKPVPYSRLLQIAAASELGAAVAPPIIGTLPVKTALLTREGLTSGEALSLSSLSGLQDWIFFLVAAPLCLIAAGTTVLPDHPGISQAASGIAPWAAAAAALLCVVLYLAHRSIRNGRLGASLRTHGEKLETWWRAAFRDLTGSLRMVTRTGMAPFLLTLSITAFQWACRYSIATVLARGLGLHADPLLFFALQVILYGGTTIVPTPGGTGGAEALFALLHRPYLPDLSLGIVMAAWRLVSFSFPCLLAALFLSLTSLRAARRTSMSCRATAGIPAVREPLQ